MPKDAFAALRAHQQLQRFVHDLSFRFQPGQLPRLAHQLLVNLNVRPAHTESIHHFSGIWCMFRVAQMLLKLRSLYRPEKRDNLRA